MLGEDLFSFELAGMVIGMREAVLGLIVVVALYIGLVLFRMLRLANRPTEVAPPLVSKPPPSTAPEQAAVLETPELSPFIVPTPSPAPEAEIRLEQAPPGMANDLLYEGMERELGQLRDEVEVMRSELAALREDMLQALAHLRATQTVSPIYGDAMQMAVAGYDAAMIAERCGIARAEAELVVALARSQV